MNYLNNHLLNKEAIRELFEDNYVEQWERDYYGKNVFLTNQFEVKIRGVKEPVRVNLFFKEPVEGCLALSNWSVEYAAVKIGEGRMAAIEDKIIETFNEDKYLIPHWIENRFQSCCHLERDCSRRKCSAFVLEKDVEPELLMDAFADSAYDSNNIEKTRLVLYNNKVYSGLIDTPEILKTDDEINEYARTNYHLDSDVIVDSNGIVYTFYHTPEDLNNIRLILKEACDSRPISRYSSDGVYTYREFAAQQNLNVSKNLPILYRTESEKEKSNYVNGGYIKVPFTQVIEMTIYSSRVLGEALPEYQLGDYVRFESNQTGFIIDITNKDKGSYGIQDENKWVYYAGEEANIDYVHISKIEKIEKPKQENVGQFVFSYEEIQSSYDRVRYGYLGEVVYEFANHFVVKVPSFKKPINVELVARIKQKHGWNSRRDYHSKYVDNGDGFIYATVRKNNCQFLKPEYEAWYKQFRLQSEPFEWIKNHDTLGKFLYPLLGVLNSTVIRPPLVDTNYQFEAFCVYVDYVTNTSSPEDLYQLFIQHLENKAYENLRNITLRNIYKIDEMLDKYFSETKIEKLRELEELLG